WAGSPRPSRDEVTSAVVRILFGPFMSGLGQYRGIGGGRLAATATVTSPDPPAPFSRADVRTMLQNQLTANALPPPTNDNQFLFAVIMPSGLQTSEKDAIGQHHSFTQFGLKIPFAWVMNDGTLNYVSSVFSHELVEACTDPQLDSFTVQGGEGSACPNTDSA